MNVKDIPITTWFRCAAGCIHKLVGFEKGRGIIENKDKTKELLDDYTSTAMQITLLNKVEKVFLHIKD